MIYIVNFSSGLASAEALRRTINKQGSANTIAVFADVKGLSTSEHAGEDQDNYRFLLDVERLTGIEITRINAGRDVWQSLMDARAITLPYGATKIARCSIDLKRTPIDKWISERYTPEQATLVVGLDWSEPHRIASFEAAKAPWKCWFPLNEKPYFDKRDMVEHWNRLGIKPPRLYEAGFLHANCGGFCVKAGLGQFERLYHWNRERFFYHAQQEARFREEINPNATILRLRRKNTDRLITLYELAELIENGETFQRNRDSDDGCGCFAPFIQSRMDDILQNTDIK